MQPDTPETLDAKGPQAYANDTLAETAETFLAVSDPAGKRRHRLSGAVITTAATKLLPLVELLDTIQPYVSNESVFRTRRRKFDAQLALAYAQLKAEKPKRKVLLHAFKTMGELMVEETRDISRDELKLAAKEVVLATLKNAPALISAAHQARLLS